MKPNIKIQENDYKRPTEVREDVVQLICDHIVGNMNKEGSDGIYELSVNPIGSLRKCRTYELYTETDETDGSLRKITNERKSEDQTRIRGCEMETVFKVMQNAGYFIFYSYYDGYITYIFSKKPSYDNTLTTTMYFTEFID